MRVVVLSESDFDYVTDSNRELQRSRDAVVDKYRRLAARFDEAEKNLESEKEHVVELEEELHQNAIELQHYKELCEIYSQLVERFCDKRDIRL